jgi:Uma2 family endonuclease
MATTATRLTYDDLDAIPQERPGDRHELIDGELVVTPSPIPNHQRISINIEFALEAYARETGRGEMFHAPADIRFTPDNVLIPDILFIAKDRQHIVGPKAIDAPPELVVEILSPGTRRRDVTIKRALYARFGVQEYWIVDPAAKTIQALALVGDAYVAIAADEGGAIHSRVLPGFVLTPEIVFARVT